MKKILIVAIALQSFCTIGFAKEGSSTGGNGGDGILIKNNIYLMDLVDAGVHLMPFFDAQEPDQAILAELKQLEDFSVLQPSQTLLLAKKISEIDRLSPILARILLDTINLYQFRLVPKNLVNIPDEDFVLNYYDYEVVQLAVRRGKVIRISNEAWIKVDSKNRVATIIHEIMYALTNQSQRARDIVAYLFSPDLPRLGFEGLKYILPIQILGFPISPSKLTSSIITNIDTQSGYIRTRIFEGRQVQVDFDDGKDWKNVSVFIPENASDSEVNDQVQLICEKIVPTYESVCISEFETRHKPLTGCGRFERSELIDRGYNVDLYLRYIWPELKYIFRLEENREKLSVSTSESFNHPQRFLNFSERSDCPSNVLNVILHFLNR